MKEFIYLHIPKTAGTALKVLAKNNEHIFKIANSHRPTIFDETCVSFGIRDPWERFCSGFWEAKTLPLRHKLTTQNEDYLEDETISFDKLIRSYPVWYTQILKECNDPNDFCSLLKSKPSLITKLYSFTKLLYNTHTPLGITTQSLMWWLGNVEEYKQFEKNVVHAIDTRSLRSFMRTHYTVEMPNDPVQSRSRAQFDIEQSYQYSVENLDWFSNYFRKEDYDLITYIKQQPYYYSAI
jgi:hypothetical protein